HRCACRERHERERRGGPHTCASITSLVQRSRPRFRSILIVVFAAALLVRLVHVWQLRPSPFSSILMGDARGYDEWAQRIAHGDWIGTDVFYQAPLYPYFLAVLYTLFGRHLLLVRIVQAFVGASSCVLLADA